jgi:hypothetical protein
VIAGFGWGYEPADDPEAHHGPDGHGGHDDGHDGAEAEVPAGDGDGDGELEPAGATGSGAASDEKASSDD